MDPSRLARLLSYRRHLERLARGRLADAAAALAAVRGEEASLFASREEHERTCAALREADAEELRGRYAHLARLERDLSLLRPRIDEHEQVVAARRDELLEARQEVKKLEALLARLEERRDELERRQSQRALDAHALARHRQEAPR